MECSICLEKIVEEKKILKCSHEFHLKCIDLWFNEKRECPVCRTPMEIQHENSEQYIENESLNIVHFQSLSNAEGALLVVSFISLFLSLLTRNENEIYLFFIIQSFICFLYVCRKISIYVIKVICLYILLSFFVNFRFYNLNYKNYNYMLLFSLFVAQYTFSNIIERSRILENN